MDLDLYFHYNRKRYKMQMVIYLDFWRGGYYVNPVGAVFYRFFTARFYGRRVWLESAYVFNTDGGMNGSTTGDVFDSPDSRNVRGRGYSIRCATDEIPVSSKIIRFNPYRCSATSCMVHMCIPSVSGAKSLILPFVTVHYPHGNLAITTRISPTPPKIQRSRVSLIISMRRL